MKVPHARSCIAAGLMLLLLSTSASASPTLKRDSHGHDVLLLQQKLKDIGYHITVTDGIFGAETERAVEEFQRDQSIKITGIVTNSTWRALKNAKERKGGGAALVQLPSSKPSSDPSPLPKGKLVPNNTPILEKSQVPALIATATQYIGTPYAFGGTTPKAFDCSGYLQYVFAKNGINIPRTADEQYKLGLRTNSSKQLVPGDLVFFTTYEPGASHCGIYLGDGEFIHASSSRGVRVDALSDTYWAPRYLGGKHIVK